MAALENAAAPNMPQMPAPLRQRLRSQAGLAADLPKPRSGKHVLYLLRTAYRSDNPSLETALRAERRLKASNDQSFLERQPRRASRTALSRVPYTNPTLRFPAGAGAALGLPTVCLAVVEDTFPPTVRDLSPRRTPTDRSAAFRIEALRELQPAFAARGTVLFLAASGDLPGAQLPRRASRGRFVQFRANSARPRFDGAPSCTRRKSNTSLGERRPRLDARRGEAWAHEGKLRRI